MKIVYFILLLVYVISTGIILLSSNGGFCQSFLKENKFLLIVYIVYSVLLIALNSFFINKIWK